MVSDPMVIRTATTEDVSLILAFIQELAEYEKLSHAVVATEASLRRELFGERPAAEVLIAEVDGAAAGFALFFHNFSTFLSRRGIYLEDLYVRPAFRRLGIGRALLTRLAGIAVERDCGRLEWSVLDWNQSAWRFYESLGAAPLEDWTTFRLTGDALIALGSPRP
ncbi:MAG: GNAT family N-acetyltransferase [Vicinamibacterales bacterium]